VLWIDHGKLQAYGDPEETVERYLRSVQASAAARATSEPDPRPISDSPIRISSVTLRDAEGRPAQSLAYGQPASVEIAYAVTGPIQDPVAAVTFHDVRGYPLGSVTSRLGGLELDVAPGSGIVRLVLSPVLFTRGSYGVTVAIHDARIQRYFDLRPRAASFLVDGPSVASREVTGHVIYPHRWEASREKVG
jgi:hypothetical protein